MSNNTQPPSGPGPEQPDELSAPPTGAGDFPSEPTQQLPQPGTAEPTQPLPMQPPQPVPGQPGGPQPGNPAMGSYSSGGVQPGYPGAGPGDPQYPGQPYPGQPYPGQPYPGQPVPGQQVPPPYQGQAAGAYTGAPSEPYPGQQYPSQPYPGQPYPGQQYPGQAYPGQPGQPQPPYGTPPRKSSKVPIIIGAVVGVLLLGLIAAFALGGLGKSPTARPSTGVTTGPTGASVPPPQPADAAGAVEGFLQALSQGDADTALAYAATPPVDSSMLTREVLAASLLRAPISDIRVQAGSGAGNSDIISASYKVGDRVVDASFPVVKDGSDWRLEEVAASVDLSGVPTDLLTLALNGVPLTSTSATLFPGSYVVTTSDERFKVSHGSFLVESTSDAPDTYSMQVALSSTGIAKVRSAAQKKLNSCLKARSLSPKGCGFGTYLPGNNKPRNSSIRWQVTKNATAMKKLKPKTDASNPTVVRANVNVQVKVNLSSTNGRRWYGYSAIYQVQGDLSGSGVKVTFYG
ncbi:MAG: hypothetical protein LCH96_12935 [Actinobacteria bacterium]|nr:hypothetical protein [Actinomycetota bacterium]